MPKPIKDFQDWFTRLLNVNGSNGQFGLDYPMGSACYRDILRDKVVKAALRDAWERIIVKGEDPHE
jgi:hypothetical protein